MLETLAIGNYRSLRELVAPSLHPDLMPALARLITAASRDSQAWVVTHSARLNAALEESPSCQSLFLDKQLGETVIAGLHDLDRPPWHWPKR